MGATARPGERPSVPVPPLPPCGPGSCVSTQSPRTDPLRRIEPLAFDTDARRAMGSVLTALEAIPRLKVLERDDVAVHAVVRTPWLRLPVDIEVRVDANRGLVHLRVATRLALRERSRSAVRAATYLAMIDRALREG